MPGAEYLQAILLGVVQGISEFLPISSSGHLVILHEPLSRWLGTSATETERLRLNVALHAGTLLSILVVYRAELRGLVRRPRLCAALALATLPAGAAGLLLKDWFTTVFSTPLIAGCCLLLTAGLLAVGQHLARNERDLDEVSVFEAVLIGLFQAAALMPGISRSGSTIAGGLLTGLRRESAVLFSFLMAVPVIAGAAALEFRGVWRGHGEGDSLPVLAVGALVSFAVGMAALRWLIRVVAQRRLHWFAWYCGLAGLATIAWQL